MVAAHLSVPFTFSCLSNVDVPDRIPTVTDWRGWWSKIELFRPGLFTGRVLYLDLDVTVCGDLSHLIEYRTAFAAISDYERPTLNSSVMAWDTGVADHVYQNFEPGLMEIIKGGDQTWITDQIPDAQLFPPEWCPSYKHHCRYSVPRGAKVIVFHGKPKPWDLKKDLVFA